MASIGDLTVHVDCAYGDAIQALMAILEHDETTVAVKQIVADTLKKLQAWDGPAAVDAKSAVIRCNRLEIESKDGCGYGTTLKVDGYDLTGVRSFTVAAGCDGPWKVNVDFVGSHMGVDDLADFPAVVEG